MRKYIIFNYFLKSILRHDIRNTSLFNTFFSSLTICSIFLYVLKIVKGDKHNIQYHFINISNLFFIFIRLFVVCNLHVVHFLRVFFM